MHDIRRALRKKVDGKALLISYTPCHRDLHFIGRYSSALVSQLYGHKDGKTYPTSMWPIARPLILLLAFLMRRETIAVSNTFKAISNSVKLVFLVVCPPGSDNRPRKVMSLLKIRSRIVLADEICDKNRGNYERLQ